MEDALTFCSLTLHDVKELMEMLGDKDAVDEQADYCYDGERRLQGSA